MTQPVPSEVHEIDERWLSLALDPTGTTSVREAKRRELGATSGVNSRVGVFDVVVSEQAEPLAVFVKLSLDDPSMSGFQRAFRYDELEWAFYRGLAPIVGAACRLPHCYHVAYDEETARTVLVMREIGGARAGSTIAPAAGDTERIVRALAKLHAHMWASPALATVPSLCELPVDQWYARCFPVFLRRFGDVVSRDFHEYGWALREHGERTCARLDEAPFTLVHGDARPENVLFTADDEPPVFLDWQRYARARGAYDIAYHLCFSAAPVDDDEATVAAYADALRGFEVDHPFERCLEDFRLGLVQATRRLVMTFALFDFPHGPARTFALAVLARLDARVAHHRLASMFR